MHGHHKQRFDSHRHPLMHSPDFFHDVTRELSARADGGHGLSSTNVIIIAVCCSVGGVVLGFVMWRLIRTCLSKSAPLPPVQPLARHRDQQRQESDKSNRVSTWNHDLAIQGRNPSHLYASEDGSDAPLVSSRHQSFQTDDTDTSPVDSALPLPNPAFRSSWGTRDSSPLSSVGALTASDEFSPPPLTPPSAANSTSSLSNSQSPQTNTSSGTFNGQPARQNKSRPISSVSSRTSLSTKNTIRGSPHGPHSNIQIILPTPLASELQPYPAGGSRVSSREDLSSRNSFVDRWLPVGGPDDNEDPNRKSMIPFHNISSLLIISIQF